MFCLPDEIFVAFISSGRGIKPGRFRNHYRTFIVICVICEICGLKVQKEKNASMPQEGMKRRLAAILSADAVGYSRLMRDDEEATIQILTAYRTVLTNLIQDYRGRVVDAPGDILLAEFGSVVDCAGCAVEIQRELAEQNADLPEDRRMQFRIGINLGDVFKEFA
jgi:class 3 adenylate cyclase